MIENWVRGLSRQLSPYTSPSHEITRRLASADPMSFISMEPVDANTGVVSCNEY